MAQPVAHFEIGCRDRAKTAEFYSSLFDWKTTDAGPATMIEAAKDGIGGHISSLGHEPHNYVLIYVQVDDIDASLAKATSLGGTVVVPNTPVPGMGYFAWFNDPEGTTVGLWKSDPTAS